jgi:hypothetical protein
MRSKHTVLFASSMFLALAGLVPARAAVIDTFSFSNLSGWDTFDTEFSGSFTGTVEASGLIELSDLSAFHVSGLFRGVTFLPNSLSNLTFFSYDTGAGASSLGFIAITNFAVCTGAPSVLSLTCNPGGNHPASTLAAIVVNGFVASTPDLTTVTLVSSVVPEISTWAMMLLGFAGLGFAAYRRRSPLLRWARVTQQP